MTPPEYATLVDAWRELAASHGLVLEEIVLGCGLPHSAQADGDGGTASLLALDLNPTRRDRIFIAAGVHGDEPVTPWALLSLVRDGLLDPRYAYTLWPCTNPSGYRCGTRVNGEDLDINRSYGETAPTPEARAVMSRARSERYRLALDLHEDFESAGFYLYEPALAERCLLGEPIIAAVEEAGYPIQAIDDAFDLGYPLEHAHEMRRIERGRVLPDVAREKAYFEAGLPLTMYLLGDYAERTLTFETPRRLDWNDRIAMHRVAVVAAIDELARHA